jgi:hypothetical protein
LISLNSFNVVCWIETNATFDTTFTPSLLVLVLKLLEHVALLEGQLIAFGALVVVKCFNGNARLA